MATINANGCYQLAAFTTTRTITNSIGERIEYCERWVLRSDGKVLARINWTDDHGEPRYYAHTRAGGKTSRLTHTSGLSVKGTVSDRARHTSAWLRAYLERKGYTITKEG